MRPVRINALIVILIFGACCVRVAVAADFSSTHFTIQNPSIGILGQFSSSAGYGLVGSGQPISGVISTSTSFGATQGFPVTLEGASTSSGGGGSGGSSGGSSSGSSGGGGTVGSTPALPLQPRPIPSAATLARIDFNHDKIINFVDFSILLFYFDKKGSSISIADLNSDDRVDLVDVSIFMYYWDGI